MLHRHTQLPTNALLLQQANGFFRDFVRFAGGRGVVAMLLVTAGALVESIGLIMVIPLVGVIIDAKSTDGFLQRTVTGLFDRIGIAGNAGQLGLLLAIFACLMIVRAVIILRRDVALTSLQLRFVESQRLEIAGLLTTAPWETVSHLRHARIAHVMGSEIQRIGGAAYFFLQSATALIMLAAQLVLAFLISPLLAAFALTLLAIGEISLLPILHKARGLGAVLSGANLTMLDNTAQFLSGLKLAMSQNLQRNFVAEFHDVLRVMTDRQILFARQQTSARLIRATLSAFVGAAAVFVGFGVLGSTPATLIALLLVLSRMSGPAGQIQQGLQVVAQSLAAYQEIKALKMELAGASSRTTTALGHDEQPKGAIEFHGVHYNYESAESRNGGGVAALDLIIPEGAVVGITGPSGAGKTTFADLLVGLLTPQRGHIDVSGKELRGTALDLWRNRLSYVSQDPFLFHDTVCRNLSWANPQASEAQMWRALAIAGADALVRSMDQGLETIVGERGSLVSGGERQRIALARALIREPELLVLDEATSAIDIAGERQFLERLLKLTVRPTIVMITHRTDSLSCCDRIYVFETGRATERQQHSAENEPSPHADATVFQATHNEKRQSQDGIQEP